MLFVSAHRSAIEPYESRQKQRASQSVGDVEEYGHRVRNCVDGGGLGVADGQSGQEAALKNHVAGMQILTV